jgi:hypothetical protein
MYPNEELTRLAADKAAMRQRISERRAQSAEAAARVARPLAWIDQALAGWRQLSPLVKMAIPLGFLLKRRFAPRTRLLGAMLRWGPLVLGAVRGLSATRGASQSG